MTVSLKHTFTSPKIDGTDTSLVQPSNWNAEHTLTAAAGVVLGRDTSGAGAVQELPIAVTSGGNVSITGTLGIGTTTPGQKLSVVGTVESTSGGFKFPDGTTQTTAGLTAISYPQNAQSNNYTLVLSDAGKHIYSANTGAQTITIPTNASVAFPIGTLVAIVNMGTTNILLGATGVSVYANGSTTTTTYPAVAPGNSVQLLKTGTNTWQGTFGTISASQITYLSVAGGGGGGAPAGGGGGGGGGFIAGSANVNTGTLTVSVGGGGTGGVFAGATATSGSNSTLTGATTATGGGYGGAYANNGANGGSGGGGGAGAGAVPGSGGSGTSGQGNAGGAGDPSFYYGGGGGGANAAGSASSSYTFGGAGGSGKASSITGSSVTYAGGGGGGVNAGTGGAGGAGGGGTGGNAAVNGTAGTANTGGGGGGGPNNNPGTPSGGAGGSGVVIISSPIAATSTTGSPTITTSGGNTIYKFTSSGTITW